MYQAIHYDYQSSTCHLRDDIEGWCQFPFKRTFYKPDPNGQFLTLDGKRVTAVNKADRDDLTIYEKDVDMNLRILLDVYREFDEAPTYHNRLFFDIETEMGGAINLEYCQKAPSKITAVAIYDDQTKQYFVYVLGDMNDSVKDNVHVFCFPDERDLLNAVLDKWKEIDPTLVISWNGDNFDIPYMYNRMKRLLGEHRANQLSPIGTVYFDEFDKFKMPYKIAGLTSLDYMRLYKKFIPKQQPSYALDAIGKAEVNRGKIVYQGSLDTLFKTDINKFIEYNVNDVQIIVELDIKKKFIDLAVMVCHMAHVPYHYVYQSSRVCEGAIMTYLKRKDIVSPNKPTTMHPELKVKYGEETEDDDKFAGAYVKTPIPGLYGWNGDEDLEALYPSCSILLNIGIDTFLFKIDKSDPFDDSWNLTEMRMKSQDEFIQIMDMEGNKRDITIGDCIQYIEEGNIIIAPNGVAFDSSTQSILAEVMDYWFLKRKEFKNIMIKYGKEGDMDKYKLYDQYQQVMKVFLNSIYGSLGLGSFRYSDGKDYLASAITAAGRLTIMRSADYVNERIHDLYEPEREDIKDYVIQSDTDSLYIEAEAILRHFSIDPTKDEDVIPVLRTAFKSLSDDVNKWYGGFAKDRFNSTNNRLKIKSETIGKRLYVSAKKQYAQYIVDKEGVKPKDPFDFKGLDFMKSSFPLLFRTFTQGIVKDILFDKPKSKIDNDILDFRDKFKTLDLKDVAKPTGVNKDFKDYIKSYPKQGRIFSVIASGTGAHIKAAIFYNDLLRFKKLDKEYSVLQIGDKVRWMYLKDNPYKIEVLAFPLYDYAPDILEFIQTYMDREEMWNSILVKKLQKIYDNLHWGEINFNKNTKKFFRYEK